MRSVAEHPLLSRLCALAFGVGVAFAAFSYESDLNLRRPPILHLRGSGASGGAGPSARVIWVLVDGLRLDASRRMTVLNGLRAAGEDVSARSEFPTFSGPNFVSQASGIEPAASRVLSNSYPGEVRLDSVFRRAKMAGLRTAVLMTDEDPGLGAAYATWVDEMRTEDPELHLPPAQLIFAHIGYVDVVGHAYGTQSSEYRAAVARADDAIGRIARSLDPTRETLIVTSDHGNLDQGGHGGTERAAVRIPIVVWGAGAAHGTRRGGRGRDVGPTIASLLGLGPLSHATGRPLVHGDVAAARQRAAARATVRASGRVRVDYIPMAIPITMVALVMLAWGSRPGPWTLAGSPTYALVFAALVLATGTLSFSISNDSALFGLRLTTLCVIAALAQLRVGGRASLAPAAFVMSLAVLGMAAVAAHEPLAPADGTLRFLPIPFLTSLAFVCLMTGAIGIRGKVRAGESLPEHDAEQWPLGDQAATDPLLGVPDLGGQALPELGGARTSRVRTSR
jgi:hypothetical protein